METQVLVLLFQMAHFSLFEVLFQVLDTGLLQRLKWSDIIVDRSMGRGMRKEI